MGIHYAVRKGRLMLVGLPVAALFTVLVMLILLGGFGGEGLPVWQALLVSSPAILLTIGFGLGEVVTHFKRRKVREKKEAL